MKLAVYSLKKILFQGEAEAVNCKTLAGEITILDHHRPLISALAASTLKITDDSRQDHYLPVKSGFLEVNANNQVRLLVDEAV